MNINITQEQVDALYLISDKGLHRLFSEMNGLYDAALDYPKDSELIFEMKEAIEAFQGYKAIFKQSYKSFNKADEPYTALRFLVHLKACRDCYDRAVKLSDELWGEKGEPNRIKIVGTDTYSPKTGEWTIQEELSQWSNQVRLITHNGETKSLSEWARTIGVSRQALHHRLKVMSVDGALTKPLLKKQKEQDTYE